MKFLDTNCPACIEKRKAMLNGLKDFYSQPFKSDGTALDWFLFWGFLIVVAFLWSRILGTITKVV